MPVTRIQDEYTVYEWEGEVLAGPVSTEFDNRDRRRVRWMKATLYVKPGGAGYVFHMVNESRVWHAESGVGHVRKPEEIPVAELDEAAEYCGDVAGRGGRAQCPPLPARYLLPTAIIELPQHKVMSFPDADAVIRYLVTANRGDGSVSMALSEPMRELLVEAEEHDPAFVNARPVMRM